jgi:hypothetical protein
MPSREPDSYVHELPAYLVQVHYRKFPDCMMVTFTTAPLGNRVAYRGPFRMVHREFDVLKATRPDLHFIEHKPRGH